MLPEINCPTIYCDYQSVIKIASNPILLQRTKHYDIKLHFIREHLKSGNIKILYCQTEKMLADAFTKPLGTDKFKMIKK